MSNKTKHPEGILILIYENGLCIDLDVRKSITSKELKHSIQLNCEHINRFVKNDLTKL